MISASDVVPTTGLSARLMFVSSGFMAFLAVFALAVALGAGALAQKWRAALEGTMTIRLSAPPDQVEVQTQAVLRLLTTTPGVERASLVDDDAQRALLSPWLGPDIPVESLPLPRLIEVITSGAGPDLQGLRLRLRAEAPAAILDDHDGWRRPLMTTTRIIRLAGWVAALLAMGGSAAMVALASNAALATNLPVLRVLRLIGARDHFILRVFVRRFTLRAFFGACLGTAIALAGLAFLSYDMSGTVLFGGVSVSTSDWFILLLTPFCSALTAFVATRLSAAYLLKGLR